MSTCAECSVGWQGPGHSLIALADGIILCGCQMTGVYEERSCTRVWSIGVSPIYALCQYGRSAINLRFCTPMI